MILNYNGAHWLAPLYEAIRRQTADGLRVYLVDNASDDESIALTQTNYPEVTVLRMPANLGYSMAYNAAMPRALADGFTITFEEADAEALPYADGSFDAVVSSYGVMFTPDQDKAAAEMLRVCRPGGKIGLANWTPQGFIGEVFKLIGRYLPPPAGMKSPLLWGTRGRLDELFGRGAASIEAQPRDFMFRYRSPAHFIEMFKTYYGPIHKAVAALDAEKRPAFLADLEALIDRNNRAKDGTMVVPGEYLEVVIVKK